MTKKKPPPTIRPHFSCHPCDYLEGDKARMDLGYYLSASLAHSQEQQDLAKTLIQNGFSSFPLSKLSQKFCLACNACVPGRVRAQDYTPSKSIRKTHKKNRDVVITPVQDMSLIDLTGHTELYRAYSLARRPENYSQFDPEIGDMDPDPLPFSTWHRALDEAINTTALPTHGLEFYDSQGRLIGALFYHDVDDGLYGLLHYYDPTQMNRSLGTYMMSRLIEHAAEQRKDYVYFASWTDVESKMHYKSKFRPFEIYVDNKWVPLKDVAPEDRQKDNETTKRLAQELSLPDPSFFVA